MNYDVVLTCAVTGAGDTTGKSPHVPVTPKEVAMPRLKRQKRVPPSRISMRVILKQGRDHVTPSCSRKSLTGYAIAKLIL